jgi:hypothetical protein
VGPLGCLLHLCPPCLSRWARQSGPRTRDRSEDPTSTPTKKGTRKRETTRNETIVRAVRWAVFDTPALVELAIQADDTLEGLHALPGARQVGRTAMPPLGWQWSLLQGNTRSSRTAACHYNTRSTDTRLSVPATDIERAASQVLHQLTTTARQGLRLVDTSMEAHPSQCVLAETALAPPTFWAAQGAYQRLLDAGRGPKTCAHQYQGQKCNGTPTSQQTISKPVIEVDLSDGDAVITTRGALVLWTTAQWLCEPCASASRDRAVTTGDRGKPPFQRRGACGGCDRQPAVKAPPTPTFARVEPPAIGQSW